ncbi:MAG: TonB-dependent receptor [Wenzhouxiangella sp.]
MPLRSRKLAHHIKLGLLMSSALAVSMPVLAQDPGAGEVSDRVTVTGTRIARTDADQINPVLRLSREDIDSRGVASVAELLEQLPIAGAGLNALGSAGTSFGAATVNLRNLGANRTLVLVNGRRWVNTGGGRGFRDFVDLNSIPLAAVESIEVLKDGASAIYGSDAIAGVVNIRTFQDFDGVSVRAQYGQSSRGDGEQRTADLTMGQATDRGSILLSVSHTDNQPIFVDDRSYSAVPLGALSLQTPFGRFVIPGQGALTLIPGRPGTSPEDFRPFNDATDRVNLFEGTYLTQPNRRNSLYGQGRYGLTSNIDLVAEAFFTRRESTQNFSPAVLNMTGAAGFRIPANHPFNPFDQDLGQGLTINYQFGDHIRRENFQKVDTLRFMLGLEGEFDNGWRWDAAASYGASDSEFKSVGQVNRDRIALGIGDVARCAATAGCVPLNLFGGPGSWTQEQLDWISLVGKDSQTVRSSGFQANLTGDLFDLLDGRVAFAAGAEYRKERAEDIPDALINSSGLFQNGPATTGPQREPTRGEFDLTEFYLELNAPLLQSRPGIERLELSAAARYSDYSTFGSELTSQFGLGWQPIGGLLFRGTYSEGFRAPSIIELFAGRRQTILPALDPCSGGGAGLPGCAGVPASYIQSGSVIQATVGSNPQLEPETSNTLTLGFGWVPSGMPNLELTADWYRIKVDDAIINIGSQRILNDCAVAGLRCNLITRDASGEVTNLVDAGVNIASQEVEGVDIVARYRLDTVELGRFEWVLDVAYLSKFREVIPDPAAGTQTVENREGGLFFRESFPRWKAQLATQWNYDAFSANWRIRHIDSMTENSAAPNIGSVTYHDLQLGYRVDAWNTRFTAGINNVFDKQPPLSLVNTNINFDISTYDARGRFFYLRAAIDF